MKSNEIPVSCTHNNEKSENSGFIEKNTFRIPIKANIFVHACVCQGVCVASASAVSYVTHPENYPNFQRDSHLYLLLK